MFESGNICIPGCSCQKELSQMFLDSVCSLCSLAFNLFSHALSVASSQVRFLIHNEHGRRQSQAKGGVGRVGETTTDTLYCADRKKTTTKKLECGFQM